MRRGGAWTLTFAFFWVPAFDARPDEPRGAVVFLSGSKLLGARGHPDNLETLLITSQGNLVVAGSSRRSKMYIARIRRSGEVLAEHALGPREHLSVAEAIIFEGYLGILAAGSGKP